MLNQEIILKLYSFIAKLNSCLDSGYCSCTFQSVNNIKRFSSSQLRCLSLTLTQASNASMTSRLDQYTAERKRTQYWFKACSPAHCWAIRPLAERYRDKNCIMTFIMPPLTPHAKPQKCFIWTFIWTFSSHMCSHLILTDVSHNSEFCRDWVLPQWF